MHKFFALNVFFIFTFSGILFFLNSKVLGASRLPLVVFLYLFFLFFIYGVYLFAISFFQIKTNPIYDDLLTKVFTYFGIKTKTAVLIGRSARLIKDIFSMVFLLSLSIVLAISFCLFVLRVIGKSYPQFIQKYFLSEVVIDKEATAPDLDAKDVQLKDIAKAEFLKNNSDRYDFIADGYFYELAFSERISDRDGYFYTLQVCTIANVKYCPASIEPKFSKMPDILIQHDELIKSFSVDADTYSFFDAPLFTVHITTDKRHLDLFLYQNVDGNYSFYPVGFTNTSAHYIDNISHYLVVTGDSDNGLSFTENGVPYFFYRDHANVYIANDTVID